jgi:hypothetical protein
MRERILVPRSTTIAASLWLAVALPVAARPAAAPAAGAQTASAALAGALTLEELRSARLERVLDEPVTLKDGVWEGAPYVAGGAARPGLQLVEDGPVTADLDGDGRQEAIVLLSSTSGGSGERLHLAVLGRGPGGAHDLASTLLGDRVMLRRLFVEGHAIVAEMVVAGPEDAACCPGQRQRRSFALAEGGLVEKASDDLGRVSLRDLAGGWRLVRTSWTERVPDGVTVTARFSGDQVAGNGGCNRYSAGVRAGDPPNGLRIGPLIATRMFCPAPRGEAESDYFRKLEAVRSFSFLVGRLALSYELDGESGSLIFEENQDREDGPSQD